MASDNTTIVAVHAENNGKNGESFLETMLESFKVKFKS